MIRVTEEAKVLSSSVDLGTLDSAEGAMTLSFAPGAGKGNDQLVQHGGKQVLRITGAVSQRLNGSTMDVVVEEGPEGMGIMPMPPDPEPLTDGS